MFYYVIILGGLFIYFFFLFRNEFVKIKKYTHKTIGKVTNVEQKVVMEYDFNTRNKYRERKVSFSYEYIVDGNTYYGFGHTTGFCPKIGSKVKIYYNKQSPGESETFESRNSYLQLIIVLVIVLLVAFISYFG